MIIALLLALGPIAVQSNVTMRCGSTATPLASLTCETGETLTYTRSVPGSSCPATDENTAYTVPGVDAPCFLPGYGIALGPSFTNLLKRSEDFTHTDWVDVGTAPTRAAGAADSPLVGADTLADSIQTAGGTQDGLTQQYSASTSGRQIVSVWAEVASGTLAWSLCVKSGTDTCNTGNGCCTNQSATTTWARASVNTTIGATAQTAAIVVVVGNDGTPTAGTLILHGAQAVTPNAGQTAGGMSYCPSTGAGSTTCTATSLLAPSSEFNYVRGAISLTYRPYWQRPDLIAASLHSAFEARGADGTHNVRRATIGGDSKVYVRNYDAAAALDENNSAASAWVVGTAKTIGCAWGDASRTVLFDGVKSTMTATDDSNMPGAAASTFYLGTGAASVAIPAFLTAAVLYRNPPGGWR